MTSHLSVSNNCNRPLTGDPSGNTFTGAFESSSGALVIAVFVASPTTGFVTINQSNNRGVNIQLTDTFNINAEHTDAMNVFRVPCGFSSFQVIFHNNEGTQTYLSLNTYLESFYNSEVNATVSGSVDATITGPLDAMGNVKVYAENLINEVNSTRRVDYLVVGNWYRVASVGITSGAQWNAIGAIVDGESNPRIGRLFQCLAVGPAVEGGGTCYDVEYTTDVSATVSGVVDVSGNTYYSDGPGTSNLNVNIASSSNGNAINVLLDPDSTVKINPAFNVVALADPTSVRIRDAYGDPITTTAGNLMVGINNIYTANPLHTILDSGRVDVSGNSYYNPGGSNSFLNVNLAEATYGGNLPVVIDGDGNTIKIDQTNNGVKVNPTAQPPVRVTGLGNTALAIGGPGLLYGASYQNKSVAVNCWIKLYNKSTAPTSADTPFLIQYLESVQQYNLTHANDNFFNAPITNTLWVRASLLPDDNDTTDTGISAEMTAFVGT